MPMMHTTEPGAALHVCRYLVEAPTRDFLALPPEVPRPRALQGTTLRCVPSQVSGIADEVWCELDSAPLLVPSGTVLHARVEKELGVTASIPPSRAGLHIPPEVMAEVGWYVLRAADFNIAVEVGCALSLLAEDCEISWLRGDHNKVRLFGRRLASVIGADLPSAVEGKLRARASKGQPPYFPSGIRWAMRRLTIIRHSGHPRSALSRGGERVYRALFKCPESNRRIIPRYRHIALAYWLLQETKPLNSIARDGEAMRLVAEGTFSSYNGGVWDQKLARRSKMWRHHGSAAAKASFNQAHGLDPEVLLDEVHQICSRELGESLLTGCSSQVKDTVLREFVRDADEPSSCAESCCTTGGAPSDWLPGTLDVARDCLNDRNRPIIRLLDGTLVLSSRRLLADRAADLYRISTSEPRRRRNSALGEMLQSYAVDKLQSLDPGRYRVVAEADLKAAGAKECDALLIDRTSQDWLYIEIGLLTNTRDIASGNSEAIGEMLKKYEGKREQIEATVARSASIAQAIDIPPPKSISILVVAEAPLPRNPITSEQMAIHSGCYPALMAGQRRWLCSIDELDALIGMGNQGWSPASLVQAWQERPVDIPLGGSLHESQLSGSHPAASGQNGVVS